MTTRLYSWLKKVRKPLEILSFIVLCMLVLTLLVVIILAYLFKVDVVGLLGKTLWDWLQLLIIPFVLAVGGYLFNLAMSRTEQQNTMDNQPEAALQEYIDKISELLLREHLGEELLSLESPSPQVLVIAQARTATILRILDPTRRGSLIQFLSQAGILAKCIGDELFQIDLSGAKLNRVNLSKFNLYEANLSAADLSAAFLYRTNLSRANLAEADLTKAFLQEADLSGADLSAAKVSIKRLKEAKSLKGATMPNRKKHP